MCHPSQVIFDRVASHLLTQMGSAYDFAPDGEIVHVYAIPGGWTSAVGCLIPPDKYVVAMEREPIEGLVQKFGLFPGVDIALLRALERIHDGIRPAEWKLALAQVAQEFGLQSGILTSIANHSET